MRLLLDTQIFLWLNLEPEKCPPRLLDMCRKPDNELVLSVASIWEIQIKHRLGKLPLDVPLSEIVEDNLPNLGKYGEVRLLEEEFHRRVWAGEEN